MTTIQQRARQVLDTLDPAHDLRKIKVNQKPTWYDRNEPVTRIVIHYTAQPTWKPDGAPYKHAWRCIHNWLKTKKCRVSVHAVCDPGEVLVCLPSDVVAYGAKGTQQHSGNATSWHLEFGCNGDWEAIEQAGLLHVWLDHAASICAIVMLAYEIPASFLNNEQWPHYKGFTGHQNIDPHDRSDPGKDFPWADFLQRCQNKAYAYCANPSLLAGALKATKPAPKPKAKPALPPPPEPPPEPRLPDYTTATINKPASEPSKSAVEPRTPTPAVDTADTPLEPSKSAVKPRAETPAVDTTATPTLTPTPAPRTSTTTAYRPTQQVDSWLAGESELHKAIHEYNRHNPTNKMGFPRFKEEFWHPGHPVYETGMEYAMASIMPVDTEPQRIQRRKVLKEKGLRVKTVYQREFTQPLPEERSQLTEPAQRLPLGPSSGYKTGRSPDIRWAQTVLADLGYNVKTTGSWGKSTTTALQQLADYMAYGPRRPGEISDGADWESLIHARIALDRGQPPSVALECAKTAVCSWLRNRADDRYNERLQAWCAQPRHANP